MMARKLFATLLCGALVLAASNVVAQEYDHEAAMAAWAKSAEPGPVHVFMADLAGDWNIQSTMWMVPGAEPTVATSSSHVEMILGGRFVDETVSGDYEGMPYEGRGLMGYDNTTHVITGIWIDNMGTVTSVLTGVYEKVGEPMELFGNIVDPISGQEMKIRTVTTFMDRDSHRMDYFVTMPGLPEAKHMEMVYTRR